MAWIADAVKARLKTDTSAIRPLNALGMNESSRPMKGREKDALRECLDRSAAAQSGHARSRYEGQAAWIYWRRGEMSKARGAILKSDQDLRKDHQNWNPAELLVSSGGAGRMKEITPTPGRASRFGLRTQFFFAAQEARRQNRPEEMLANLREALRYRPEWEARSRSMMRWRDGYMSLGRLDEAIAEYERGLKPFPGMAWARFHLAGHTAARQSHCGQGAIQRISRTVEACRSRSAGNCRSSQVGPVAGCKRGATIRFGAKTYSFR
jgi:tetratricopeptide (TPR) repeat protein